jgi:hypothetical protein
MAGFHYHAITNIRCVDGGFVLRGQGVGAMVNSQSGRGTVKLAPIDKSCYAVDAGLHSKHGA